MDADEARIALETIAQEIRLIDTNIVGTDTVDELRTEVNTQLGYIHEALEHINEYLIDQLN